MKKIVLLNSTTLIFFVFVAIGCSNEKKAEELFVDELARQFDLIEDSTIVSISKLTSFNWDTLYIIAPYTSNYEVNKILNLNYIDNNPKRAFVDDDCYTRFLFRKDNSIVKDFEVYDSDIGKSFGYLNQITFSNSSAKFVIKKKEYQVKALKH